MAAYERTRVRERDSDPGQPPGGPAADAPGPLRAAPAPAPVRARAVERDDRAPQVGGVHVRPGDVGQVDAPDGPHAELLGSGARPVEVLEVEQHHVTARLQDVETLGKGGLAHRIIHDLDTLTARQTPGLALKIIFGIKKGLKRGVPSPLAKFVTSS